MGKKIVILGAGPAGMACAMELSRKNVSSLILEKDSAVGGLAKTLEFKEKNLIFRTDIGPHRFFSKNKYLYDFIEDLLDEKWIQVKRQTRQLIEGKFYDYPINAAQAIKNIGFSRSLGMGISYILAVIKYRMLSKEIKTFEDYAVANFGRKLAEFNMLNYTEKIWGIPCSEIHTDWAKQRIKGLSLTSALKNILFKKSKRDGPKTLVDSFYYPQYGTGLIYETILGRIRKKGSEVEVNSEPLNIFHKNMEITDIEARINNIKKKIKPDKVISTIPINHFIKILSPSPPKEVIDAVEKLKWRSQIYLFITLNKRSITKDNWIYFPNKEIPFGRTAEMKNFSKDMSPDGKTSLIVEFFVTENDEIWKMGKEELFNLACPYFENLGLFNKEEVRNFYLLKRSHVYPVYDINYQKHLEKIKKYLDGFSNLYFIGRPGRFKYNNQDHSLEMGIMAARSILDNKKYDFDLIGGEKEYFEEGNLKDDEHNKKS